ncbi:MAG TPA: CarD family transcriptional regulator [Bauldia sp.]|nr:CarD family transcriptional regulator [Bauldia sp.]
MSSKSKSASPSRAKAPQKKTVAKTKRKPARPAMAASSKSKHVKKQPAKPVARAAAKKPAAASHAHAPKKTVAATVAPQKAAAPQKKPPAAAAASAKPVVAKPALVPAPAAKVAPVAASHPGPIAAAPAPAPAVKKPPARSEFKIGEHIVYPAHGVGRIMAVETQEVAGIKLDLFVVSFIKDKMTLRVPVAKAQTVGMRKLADNPTVKRALETVRGRARIKRTMWSRRAQEYEAKINSGDLISIAEVVRDLFRSENQPEQSYSERQLYEAALDRMSREISSVSKISETEAVRQIEQNLAKSPRRGAKPEGAVPEAVEQERAA